MRAKQTKKGHTMASKLAQLRAQRDAKAKAAHDLNAKTPSDQRMNASDASALDAMLAEVEAIGPGSGLEPVRLRQRPRA